MDKVSICIVTHNNEKEILNLIKSIYLFTEGIDFKIYIVDNNSKDETIKLITKNFPNITIIKSRKNLGFGKAHNLVLNKITSDFHIIINPDIVLKSNAIMDLLDYLKRHKDVVIVTPKIVFEDGKIQFLPKKDPKVKYMLAGKFERYSTYFESLRREYTMQKKSYSDDPFCIDFCTGCFMLIRTKIFKKLKGFDERFFMYLEDADLSRRARKYGKIMFIPKVEVIHTWHRESSKNIKFFLIHLVSMFKYFIKWKNH